MKENLEKHRNYELTLPEGYQEDKIIDAKHIPTAIMLNVVAFILFLLVLGIGFVILYITLFSKHTIKMEVASTDIWVLLGMLVGMFLYIVSHELVHGLCYKLLTKQKLTFGLTLSCAFCGVPQVYTYKKCALITILAPFVVFHFVFILPMFWVTSPILLISLLILEALHFSGCIGDLYCASLILFKYKGKAVLVNDTGPKQTFYVPISSPQTSDEVI
ncbi:MAG: DUF3267 domain-containing protein [Prevotella sp.]|nr:DUF3267 domain-containing protein [Staphylococcus sp.]MCM1350318.1 DUF3267 domain-containing protein [Prevotella sp.]